MDGVQLILKVVGIVKDNLDDSNNNAPSSQQVRPAQRPVTSPVEREKTAAEWKSYFKEILSNEFPSYTIRENVPVTDLAGFVNEEFKLYKTRTSQAYKAEWGQPYTFVLENGGKAIATIMLGNGHSHDSNVKYLIARMYAKKLDIPYINFYTQMDNEKSYVIGSIHKFLN